MVAGLACYVLSVLWAITWDHFGRHDPRDLIFDRGIPIGPWILMELGNALFAVAFVLEVIVVTRYVIWRIRGLSQ